MAATVDTRFFLSHYLADTDTLRANTSRKMIELQRESAIVPTIVLHEVYRFECESFGKEIASLCVDSILTSHFRTVELTSRIAVTSAHLRCRYRDLPAADSIVAATSIETESKRVLSDDPHFKAIREIQREWL